MTSARPPALHLSVGVSPALAELLGHWPDLSRTIGETNAAADELEFAIAGGRQPAARADELHVLREREARVNRRLDDLDGEIEAFPSRTIGDVIAKLRHYVFMESPAAEADIEKTCRESDMADRLVLRAILDLERLAANGS